LTFGVKNDQILALKKVDGSWFFWSIFCFMASKSDLLGFIEKQAPQKALCLGPDPPPGEKMKFIDFYHFFTILGPSIEPEKPSVKSASTPYPPWNDHFIANLLKISILWVRFNNSLLNCSTACLSCIFGIVFQAFRNWGFNDERRSSFFCCICFWWFWFWLVLRI
jgi:hypothetical protein